MMDKIIDRLFKRLAATYGSEWDRSLSEIPISDTRTVWAHELQVFERSLGRIAWALENLPERCPNVIAFKRLCQSAPAPNGYADGRPAVEVNREPVDPAIAKMLIEAIQRPAKESDIKNWARILKKRHEDGDKLNPNQIRCYKNALGLHAGGVQL